MSKIQLNSLERNALIDFLEDQSIDKSRMLYGLLKESEEPKQIIKSSEPIREVHYKSDRELHPEKYENEKSCRNCRYYKNFKCSSKLFNNDSMKSINECMEKEYKYWEEKDA